MAVRGRFERLFIQIGLWCIAALLLAAIVFMAFAVFDVSQKERRAHKERSQAEAVREALEERHQALEARVALLETERGVEEELRERFLVAKEGEEVVIMVDGTRTELDTPPPPRKSVWDHITSWFGF